MALAANSSPAASQHIFYGNRPGLMPDSYRCLGIDFLSVAESARAYSGLIPVPVAIPFWLPGCAVGWLSPAVAVTYKGELRVRHIFAAFAVHGLYRGKEPW